MNRQLVLNGIRIADDTPCFTIAEIGANHQGDLEICKKLFDAAKAAGASCVKMQKRSNASLFTKQMYESEYQSQHAFARSYGTHREFLEFDEAQYAELKAYAEVIGITFLVTAYDFASADFLAALDIPAFKIASCDLINTPLLQHVARIGKPIFLSTGGSTMEDIRRAHDAIFPINQQLCLLQCTSAYPPRREEMNLNVIGALRAAYPGLVIGFSSHDDGVALASIAYALGARVVEKHFTLDRSWKGSDHACSIEQPLLRQMVLDLEELRVSLGDGVKVRYESEAKSLHKLAKKLVAADDLPANLVIGPEHIAIKSPGDGAAPYMFESFLGRKLNRSLRRDDNLVFDDTSVSP